MLNTNHLSFVYSFLLSLAFLLLMHCARHFFATYTLANGVSIERVAKMLGHSDTKMTRHCAKVLDQTILREMNALPTDL